jgi:uncharacterized protein (DUF1800 family)
MVDHRRWLYLVGGLFVGAACGSGSQGEGPEAGPDGSGPGIGVDGGPISGGDSGAPPPPTGPVGDVAAAQLLIQGTFGPTLDTVSALANQSYDDWFAAQAAVPPSLEGPILPPNATTGNDQRVVWWTTVVNGPDQLRQRVAFALSEIFVISNMSIVFDFKDLGTYYDVLTQNALGNFRDLLTAVSLSPVMGVYLTYFKNDKPDPATNTHADENYARELMQLFTIGLYTLNADGTPKLDASGNPIAAYTQADVENLARVLTGWGSNPIPPQTPDQAWQYAADYVHPMVCYQTHHDTDAKTIVGGVALAAGGTCDSDLKIALDTLFNHPNVGPFIGKQLIQRLVTSNPSPGYVSRVAAVFANDGTGVRGNLLAVVKAVLTDVEARTPGTGTGKVREPLLRATEMYRAFAVADNAPDAGTTLNLSTAAPAVPTIDDYTATVASYEYMAEQVMNSPTVFNFFRPDYTRAGPLAAAGLVAPELQITNEATIATFMTWYEASSYEYVDSKGVVHSGPDQYATLLDPTTALLHTAEWEPFAADPATLVDKLNLVLMAGQMPDQLRTGLIDYITPLTDPAERVINAAFMLGIAPQYAVQR